ncbi:MAG: hypothetical protein H8E16_14520 [Flavobacteriales bacterium]|nr:hypothetical protein [Flavobacteriales bacterium]
MSDNKKKSKTTKPTKTRSFTETIFIVYAFLFFTVGILLLFFTDKMSLIVLEDEHEKIIYLYQQFLANIYILLGVTTFFVRKLTGRKMITIIISIILVTSSNMYLSFLMNDYTTVPSEHFIAQILIQLSLVVALIEQVKRK